MLTDKGSSEDWILWCTLLGPIMRISFFIAFNLIKFSDIFFFYTCKTVCFQCWKQTISKYEREVCTDLLLLSETEHRTRWSDLDWEGPIVLLWVSGLCVSMPMIMRCVITMQQRKDMLPLFLCCDDFDSSGELYSLAATVLEVIVSHCSKWHKCYKRKCMRL